MNDFNSLWTLYQGVIKENETLRKENERLEKELKNYRAQQNDRFPVPMKDLFDSLEDSIGLHESRIRNLGYNIWGRHYKVEGNWILIYLNDTHNSTTSHFCPGDKSKEIALLESKGYKRR